jgi:TetR/AcrR family transcriptional repressor of nem operon
MPGRPLEFEPLVAIERAMHAFWEGGFAATSVQDLVDATGVPRQSLYNTLGDKRTVYLAALDMYVQLQADRLSELRRADASLDSLDAMLRELVGELTAHAVRPGLFHVNAAAELGGYDDEVAQLVQRALRSMSSAFGRALRQGIEDGSVRGDVDPNATARALTQFALGLATASQSGAQRRSLMATVDATMAALRA